ncbi:MAG: PAS domain S-box protein [Syntrophorhabdaceae bacterium]|nr:PAS domain S-box protein [Syntrophorhabdaceae bacterium]
MDLLPQTVFEADSEGLIRFINRIGSEILGYPDGEMREMKIFDLVVPEERQEAIERFRRKAEGYLTDPSNYTIRRKDGSTFPAIVYSTPATFSDGTIGLRGIMADITVQKRTEERLRESEERFRTLFDAVRDAVFIKDTELRYSNANPAMSDMTGISREGLIGATDGDLFDEATAGWIKEHDLRVLRGETVETENTIAIGDRTVLAHVIKVPMRDCEGRIKGVCGIARDVTRRRQIEKALGEADKKYRTVIEHLNEGVAIVSGDRHIFVNQFFLDMFGFQNSDEVLNGEPYSWVHSDDRGMVMERNRRRQQGDEELPHYRFRGLRTDGKVISVDVSAAGMILGGEKVTLAFLHDITERELAAQRIEAERRRLFDIIDFLPDATLVIDNDKRVIAWNRAMESLTGTRKEDILGKGDYTYAEAFYGEKRPMLIDAVQEEYPGMEDRYEFMKWSGQELYAEAVVKMMNDQKQRHLWGAAAPLFDMDGNRIGAIESIRDVTEQKELASQYLHSQKMEAVGNLAAGIAHDFNNILSVIMGYSSLLQAQNPPDDPRHSYAGEILAATTRASHLTNSLLAFSRKQMMDMKPVELNGLIMDSRKLLSRLLTEDIEFVVEPASQDVVVMADRFRIEQVLMNLVSNARDAMRHKGNITIRIERRDVDGTVARSGRLQEGREYAVISCTDSGSGMDSHVIEHIFEPFYTTKKTGRGTGLGLSMALGIVEQHEGYIHVESERGRGSVFSVYIPVARQSAAAEEEKEAHRLEGGGETILLAEDDPSLRTFTGDLLKSYGYTVLEAANGEEAVERFSREKDRIDLLFLDVVMPGRNGREVYDAARSVRPDIKVLFYSGHTDDVILHRGVSAGQFLFLKKPVSPEDMLAAVRKVLKE